MEKKNKRQKVALTMTAIIMLLAAAGLFLALNWRPRFELVGNLGTPVSEWRLGMFQKLSAEQKQENYAAVLPAYQLQAAAKITQCSLPQNQNKQSAIQNGISAALGNYTSISTDLHDEYPNFFNKGSVVTIDITCNY
jgi:hypothetical protein